MFKVWNYLQDRVNVVKEEEGETIRYYHDQTNFVLSNGVNLRDLRDGRFVSDDGKQWAEAFDGEDDDFYSVGLFYCLEVY